MRGSSLVLTAVVAPVFLLLAACSLPVGQSSAPEPKLARIPEAKSVPEAKPFQVGFASWYGPGFHGKVTASGRTFDQHDHTAAHKTLPLGTRVRVTNLANGKSTEVTIIDRGPYARDRIIDLSSAAAEELGMKSKGTVRVRLEILEDAVQAEQTRSQLEHAIVFSLSG
jgi:peptidoglycan lytic transglycosylase